jgi:hypothetical protein
MASLAYMPGSEVSLRDFSSLRRARTPPPPRNSPRFDCLRCAPPYKNRAMSVVGCHGPIQRRVRSAHRIPFPRPGALAPSILRFHFLHCHPKCRQTGRTLPKSEKTCDQPSLASKGTRPRWVSLTERVPAVGWLVRILEQERFLFGFRGDAPAYSRYYPYRRWIFARWRLQATRASINPTVRPQTARNG